MKRGPSPNRDDSNPSPQKKRKIESSQVINENFMKSVESAKGEESGMVWIGYRNDFLYIWDRFEITHSYTETRSGNGWPNPLTAVKKMIYGDTKIGFDDLVLEVKEGRNKGKTALWFLAKAARARSGPFMQVWTQFIDQIELKHLLVEPKSSEDEDAGRSALWFLARFATMGIYTINGSGECEGAALFMFAWNKFKHEIELENLLFKSGYHKSTLAHLVNTAVEWKNVEPLWQVLDEFKRRGQIGEIFNYVIVDLTRQLAKQYSERARDTFGQFWNRYKDEMEIEQWRSVLTLLVNAGTGNTDLLMQVLDAFKQRGLIVEAIASVFFEFPDLNSFFKDELGLLNKVWNRYKDEIKPEQLKVALSLLQCAACLKVLVRDKDHVFREEIDDTIAEYSEQWEQVIAEFKQSNMAWETLTTPVVDGVNMILLLARYQQFTEIWNIYNDRIKLKDLLQAPGRGPFKSASALWFLARNEVVFMQIWERCKESIKLEHLRCVPEGLYGSALDNLAGHVDSKLFLEVLQQYKSSIEVEDLINGKWHAIFWYLVHCARDSKVFKAVVHDIVAQCPGLISEGGFYDDMLKLLTELEIFDDLPGLMTARNALFMAIEHSGNDVQLLLEFAENALHAGYINAFYDVGKYFMSKSDPYTACQAFEQVPPESWHYQKVLEELVLKKVSEAIVLDNATDIEKEHAYREALAYALKLENSESRKANIQRIGSCFIAFLKEEHKALGKDELVPEAILNALNNKTTVDECFIQFKTLSIKPAILTSFNNSTANSFQNDEVQIIAYHASHGEITNRPG